MNGQISGIRYAPDVTAAVVREVTPEFTRTELRTIGQIQCNAQLDSREGIYTFVSALLCKKPTEHCIAVYCDNQLRPVCYSVVSIGNGDQVIISIPQIARIAILSATDRVFFAHNHVSGYPIPSDIDRSFTTQLHDALDIIGISLMDSLIVGVGGTPQMYSMRLDDMSAINIWKRQTSKVAERG